MSRNAANGVYELWLHSAVSGARFSVVSVPSDIQYATSLEDVNPEETTRLFEAGRALGRTGTPWHTMNPPVDQEHLQQLLSGEPLGNAFERNMFAQTAARETGQRPAGETDGRCGWPSP